ncbi:hypothetical protein V7S43_004665 [Phytophthora oleae]|uniref:SAC3/GANP/THP3 conserved domain-containing protein n=1 Tax=Phytophthora oleae TaxID=2107226 RepID=A0ABD3FXF0_9STRA
MMHKKLTDRGRGRQPRRYRGRGRNSYNNASSAPAPPPAPVPLQQGPIRGECEALCPPKEIVERARNQELSRFERPAAGCEGLQAVKKYRRAAAGRDVWDPSELRPPSMLLQTLRHLFTTVLPWTQSGFDAWKQRGSGQAVEFLAVYHFVNDRVRSVRQDFTVQVSC